MSIFIFFSGSKDHVFVNFADHGGPGILCFPEADLSANDLLKTLKEMEKQKKYEKVCYIFYRIFKIKYTLVY